MSLINIDEQVKEQNRILENLTYINRESYTKKKDLIIQFKEVTRPLVLAGYYPDVQLSDLCSFIGKKLSENSIEYSSGHLAELFDDDEKRTQHRSTKNSPDGGVENSPPLDENPSAVQGSIIGQLDYLEKQIGKSYDVMEESDYAEKLQSLENISAKNLAHIKSFDKTYKTLNHFVDTIEKTFGSVETAEDMLPTLPKKQRERLDALITKYHNDVLLITEFEESLADIKENEIKEIQVTQAMTSKDIDQRSKLTNWEKLMIVLAMKAGGIAKNQCAKLNGIDKKHITNNIYPESSPVEPHGENKHHRYLSWFKAIRIDGKTFDISRWFDEQIERKKLGLEFKPAVLETKKIL